MLASASGRRSALAGLAVILTAALVLVLAPHWEGQAFELKPDALEYAVVAERLVRGEPPTLPIGDATYPSRYPIGYPLLLVPAAAAGVPPEWLWAVSAVVAVSGVAFTYRAALELSGALVAAWAALVVALAPLFARYGVMLMSDAPSAAAAALWTLFALTGRAGALGAVAAFACSMRLMNVALLVAGPLACPRRGLVRFFVGAAFGVTPLVVTSALGTSGLLGGYAFWAPEHYANPASAFTFAALRANAPQYLATLSGVEHRLRFYPALLPVLAAVGVWRAGAADRRRPVLAAAFAAILEAGLALAYFFHDRRLLLPVLPIVAILAAPGLFALGRKRPKLAALVAVSAMLLQFHALARGFQGAHREPPVAPLLRAVAAKLPANGVVATDVSMLLAWLYWTDGPNRELVPIAVRPRGSGHPLADRHVRRLVLLAARDPKRRAPALFLGEGRGSIAADVRAAVVLCTPYGRRDILPALAPRASAVDVTSVPGCVILADVPAAPAPALRRPVPRSEANLSRSRRARTRS